MIALAYAGLITTVLSATTLATAARTTDTADGRHQQALVGGALMLAVALMTVGLIFG